MSARRTWLIGAGLLALVAALATFVVLITVRYRDGLEQRLRSDLISGAAALSAADTPGALKSVIGSLSAEGISVDLSGVTASGGTLKVNPGGVMTVREQIPIAGEPVPATLTGSSASIDRQVHSLEVTEVIGGLIVLALLATLGRVLVLLDRAVAQARASEAAMRTFLADASHELRTPVAALQATAERLLREQPTRPARDAIEAELARGSRRLGHLTDDLLNLARLDAREQPHRERLDLADLASAAVAAADGDGRVRLVSTRCALITGDRDALLRALRNLIDNALAVSDAVVVEVAPAANGPSISVTDNGPGVPADQRERIFEPFVRLAANGRNGRNGTGLGLAIVRRTIEAHGGTVTCEAGPGAGARFTVRLPPAS